MTPTKRAIRKCLNLILAKYEKDQALLSDKQLRSYCANPKHKRCIDILEDIGAVECIYYDDRAELIAVYPTETAARIEFEFGAAVRDKVVFYGLGFLSALAVWGCTEYLLPWLIKGLAGA